jgi:hypothetical protein
VAGADAASRAVTPCSRSLVRNRVDGPAASATTEPLPRRASTGDVGHDRLPQNWPAVRSCVALSQRRLAASAAAERPWPHSIAPVHPGRQSPRHARQPQRQHLDVLRERAGHHRSEVGSAKTFAFVVTRNGRALQRQQAQASRASPSAIEVCQGARRRSIPIHSCLLFLAVPPSDMTKGRSRRTGRHRTVKKMAGPKPRRRRQPNAAI